MNSETTSHRLSRVLYSIAVFFLYFGVATANAGVKCTCPTIDAEGEGNTSCSVSESNNKCTIDYNLFAEREARAAQLLAEFNINLALPHPNLSSASLPSLSSQERVDAVILFLSVAASSEGASISYELMTIIDTLRWQYSWLVEQAFGQQGSSTGILVNDHDVVISHGCIEMSVAGLWVMFKASWSHFREAPRCGGNDLRP